MAYGALGVYRLRSPRAVYEIIVPEEPGFDREQPEHYATIDGYMYYASFGGYMYRVSLQTFSRELYLHMPVFGVITDGERLFFSTADNGARGLLSHCPATGDMQALTNVIDVNADIRYYNGMIFFVDNNRQIRSILPCGRPVATHSPTNVATFDVRLPYLIFMQHGCDLQKEYNMNTGAVNFP